MPSRFSLVLVLAFALMACAQDPAADESGDLSPKLSDAGPAPYSSSLDASAPFPENSGPPLGKGCCSKLPGSAAATPPPTCGAGASPCLFGDCLAALPREGELRVTNEEVLNDAAPLDAITGAQLLEAARRAEMPRVSSLTEFFETLKPEQPTRTWIYDAMGARRFRAYSFIWQGALQGAVFEDESLHSLADIAEGAFRQCAVKQERCLFGSDFPSAQTSPRFSQWKKVSYRDAANIPARRRGQALRALQETQPEIKTLEEGLKHIDDSTLELFTFRASGSRASFYAWEYGAGDNAYGAIFRGDDKEAVAVINDSDLFECRLFEAPDAASGKAAP